MNLKQLHRICGGWALFGSVLCAQTPTWEKAPVADLTTVQGVKTGAGEKKAVPQTSATAGGVTAPPPPNATGVYKSNGIENANGIQNATGIKNANGISASTPVQPPPPKSEVRPTGGLAVEAGGATIGSGDSIRAVRGVTGITPPKIRNLEAALLMKQSDSPPAPAGAANAGKGKAAAAALLSSPAGKTDPPPAAKTDGRGGFQEFEKLQNNGS